MRHATALVLCVCAIVVPGVPADDGAPPDTGQSLNPPQTTYVVEVGVDPHVELMAIVCRLAAFPYYVDDPVPGYAREVDSHFGPHRRARAPVLLAELREAGMPVGVPVMLAACISGAQDAARSGHSPEETPAPRPFRDSQSPSSLEDGDVEQLVGAVSEFDRETGFQEFREQHADLYAATGDRVGELVTEGLRPEWFGHYFGVPHDSALCIHVALLGGGLNLGVRLGFDGTDKMHVVLCVADRDGDGLPDVGDDERNTIVHELCHGHMGGLTAAHAEELREAGEILWSRAVRRLADSPYTDWLEMIEESIVRACTSRYLSQNVGWWEATRDALNHQVQGFTWVPALATLLEEQYDADRETYPTFDSFMPQIVGFFNEYAEFYRSAPPPPEPEPQEQPAGQPEQARDPSQDVGVAKIEVDPHVELMAIICRLAGFPCYADNPVPGYARDVDSHFGPHHQARAPALFAELREAGMSVDVPPVMAALISGGGIPVPRRVEDCRSLFSLHPRDVQQALGVVREFGRETGFQEFREQHGELYATTVARVGGLVAEVLRPGWFSRYFGAPLDPELHIHVVLFGGGYSLGVRFTSGDRDEVHVILGVSDRDGDDLPDVGDVERNTIAHELCGGYVSDLAAAHADDLREAGEVLWSRAEGELAGSPRTDWLAAVEESVVRACLLRYLSANVGRREATRAGPGRQTPEFTWVPALATVLEEQYEADRQTYPTFESFMPQIVRFFNEYAESHRNSSLPPEPEAQEEPAGQPEQDTPDYVDAPEVAA